jgi:predicted kinase
MLIIMQGHSGSGKSTLAKTFKELLNALGHKVTICSTDDEFARNNGGVYKFDPSKLAAYHKKNLENATRSMEAGDIVIVDNTNTCAWEAKPYVEAAQRLSTIVHFVRATGDYQNTHGVPPDKVKLMKDRLEDLSVENCLKAVCPWDRK